MTVDVAESLPSRAARVSEELLAPLERRWRHVQGVGHRVQSLTRLLQPQDRPAVVAAAWLHDIGYAPTLVVTGFHPIDGANYLREQGWPDLIVAMVAHHTGAEFEAEERGFTAELHEFPRPAEDLLDLVTTADLMTSPDGDEVSSEIRIVEILHRYPPEHPVHRAVSRSAPSLRATVQRVTTALWREHLTLADIGFTSGSP